MNNITSNRKLTAIMFADIVSYSRLMGMNEVEAIKLKVLDVFDSTATAIILEKKNPYLNLKLGDKLTYEFPF